MRISLHICSSCSQIGKITGSPLLVVINTYLEERQAKKQVNKADSDPKSKIMEELYQEGYR